VSELARAFTLARSSRVNALVGMYSSENIIAMPNARTRRCAFIRQQAGAVTRRVLWLVPAAALAVGGGLAAAVVGDGRESGEFPGRVGHLRQGAQGGLGQS
jgi:hypothetical protein